MNIIHTLSLAFLALAIFSCSAGKKAASSKELLQDSLPPLPLSQIDIPIRIYAIPLLDKIERNVSLEFTSESWPNYLQPSCDFRYKYRFVRSPFSIRCLNNRLDVQFTGKYQVAGSRCLCSMDKPISPWISGSCGFGTEAMRKVAIGISSQLDFLPGYQLRTRTRLYQLKAPDKCQVSLLSNDVTGQILDSVKSSVAAFCSALDSTVAGFNFSGMLNLARDKAFRKTDLGKYGYLQVNPASLRIGQLNYARDSFAISFGISCKPELSSDSVNPTASSNLPPLIAGENKNDISLYLNGGYDYAFLSKLLRDTLYNKVFELQGRTVVIRDLTLRGIGNRQIELKVDFAGSHKGSIFLRGTPVLDTAKQTLTIPDISYSLESQDLAIKIAKSLFKNKIRKTIQGKTYLDIGALVKSNLAEISSSLNRQVSSNISSRGQAKDVKLIGLLAREDKLLVQVYVRAELAVLVNDIL